MADADLVEIYRARNLPEAHAIRLMMEREGVAVSISNETLQGIVGEVAMGWSTSPRLMVGQQDADQARRLLDGFVDSATRQIGSSGQETCLSCGAAMPDGDVCLACGWTYGDSENVAGSFSTNSSSNEPKSLDVGERVDGNLAAGDLIPVLSDRSLMPARAVWWEVIAVLCIGFFPNMASSLFHFIHPAAAGPYWASAVEGIVYSFSTTFATLYVIHRSGERWSEFGFSRLRVLDVVLALILVVVIRYFGGILQSMVPREESPAEAVFTVPSTPGDYALMPLLFLLSALSEEVVMRAYLMTRLRHLFHQPWLAVVISAALFASYHSYQGIPGLVNALFVGIVLGSVFSVYPRIWPLVICHTLSNIWLELEASAPPVY